MSQAAESADTDEPGDDGPIGRPAPARAAAGGEARPGTASSARSLGAPTGQGDGHRSPARRSRPRPGLTARGVVVLIGGATLLAGVLGVIVTGHRTGLFGVTFTLASTVGAYLVRRKDIPVAMVAPPLVYCVLIAVMSLIDRSGLTGSLPSQLGVSIGTAFVTGAPAIWSGSALAAGIGWYRLRSPAR